MDIEEYSEPGSYAEEGDSYYIEPGSGTAFGVGAVTASGQATTRCGGAPAYAPLAWGSCEAAEYGSVSGWEVVTDLDGAGGEHVPGRLLAAYWQGKIWLKLSKDGEAPAAGNESGEECCGAGYVGCAGADGLPQDAPGRAVLPQVYLCPMEWRERFLKTADGRWRGDVWWEVLANYSYHPDKGHWVKDPAGNDEYWSYGYANVYRVTIWAVACGNVLCFYTTRSWCDTEDLREAAPVAQRMRWSAWGVPYWETDAQLDYLTRSGGPFAPIYCALLPWEAEGTEPAVYEDGLRVQAAVGLMGTENFLGRAGTVPGLPAPAAMAAPVSVCGRFHYGGRYGAAWLALGWPEAPTVEEATGYPSWTAAVRGFLLDEAAGIGHAETAQDYRFDPASIEGKGVSFGYCVGWYTPGDVVWPAVAPPYELLAAEQLESPYGKLYLAIAGSTADGVLLTASCFAEPPEGTYDPDNPTPEPGTYPVPPGPIIDPPTPAPEPGPGPWYPPGGDDDDDEDDDSGGGGGGGGATTLEDGYYYTAGDGVAIRATRTNVRDANGKVVGIEFGFDIDVTEEDLFWTAATRYQAEVSLSTSNGGTYTYREKTCTMYYGFTSSSYEGMRATLNWRSSWMHSDSDPKSCTVRAVVTGTMTVAALFPQSGWADSESLARSNILSFKDAGRQLMYSTNGVKRYFKVYKVSLKKGVLKGIALRKALEAAPQMTVSPGSVSGTNTGEPSGGPTVTASAAGVTPSHANNYSGSPASVTGCMPAEFAADFTADGDGSVGVSGSASWHYDPDEASASGSIDAEFTVSLQDQSIEL